MTGRRSFLAGAAVAATAAATRTLANAQTTQHLDVGTAPIDSGLTPVVGVRSGAFKRTGLDVNVQLMNSGAAIAAAVVGGSLQIGASSLLGLVTAHVKGIPIQIVAPLSIYISSDKPATQMLARKDAPLKTGADLNGKTIASPALGDLLSMAMFAWVDQNGGDSKTVKHVELPASAMLAALDAGRIDAASFAEPRLSEALAGGTVRVVANVYDAIAKRFLVSALVSTSDYINANRDIVLRFSKAQREANAFANAHPDQTAPWLAEIAKMDVATVNKSKREIFAETTLVSDIQVVIDAAAKYKVIDKRFDARDLISAAALTR